MTVLLPQLMAYLDDLQVQVHQWANENGLDEDFVWKYVGVTEELGELGRSLLKDKQGIRGTHDEWEDKGQDAVGDILVYLMDFCSKKEWKISDCLERAWGEASQRDWIAFPKNGVSE